ncbi:hypothetical protein FACS189437_06550 [Bacteroidia bacterium]|nr:hypothetical protein FACS189437_06550 [Bacteroidia bacterium]
MNKIHIGEIICLKMKEEGRTKKWLANQVNCDPSCFCKTLKKSSMDTSLLMDICFALKHNFFQYLSAYYNEKQQHKQEDGK